MTSSKASTSPFSSYTRRLAPLAQRLAPLGRRFALLQRKLTPLGQRLPPALEGVLHRGDPGTILLRQPARDEDIVNSFRLALGRTPTEESIAGKRGKTVGELMATLLASQEFREKGLPALLGEPDPWSARHPQEWADLEDYLFDRFGAVLEGNEASRRDYLLRIISHRNGALFRQLRALKGSVPADLVHDLKQACAKSAGAGARNGLDADGVRAITMLFLGRYPNANDDVTARAALGSSRLVKRLLSSAECDTNVLQAVVDGRSLPHCRSEATPPDWVRIALARTLKLTPKGRRAIRAASSWEVLLGVILKDDHFERVYLPQKPGKPGFTAAARVRQAREALGVVDFHAI